MSGQEVETDPSTMLLDALRWNMLNVVRVELFFNCYRIWTIFVNSSLQSPRGQYAIVSLLITLLAQFAIQFNFSWLLSIYTIYLAVGMATWLHRRVYFYHRRLDSIGVNQTINSFDLAKSHASHSSNGTTSGGTLKHSDKHGAGNNPSGSSSSSSTSTSSHSENTNSLQRQRAIAYRDFQSILSEPRQNHREFAVSLAHLSHISKLVADKDIFDEMHFQILATRRDVVNIILRLLLVSAATMLAYFR